MNNVIKISKAFKHLDPSQGLAGGISSGFSSIRYRGKAWSLQHGGKQYPFRRDDDGTPLSYIDVIILGSSPNLSKVYFGNSGEWSEDSASGPICASLKGDVPDPGVPMKQAKSCGICPHNEWITKPGGGRGKECQDHKRIAVLLMPYMTKKMLPAPLIEPVFFKVPPGSLKALKSYSDELVAQGIPFAAVITRVSFSSDRLFQMNFSLVQALTDNEADTVLPLMDSPQTAQIVGSMPEIREIAQELPEPRMDTGLLQAFGKGEPAEDRPVAKTRGRPLGAKNKPKAVVIDSDAEDDGEGESEQKAAPAPKAKADAPTPDPEEGENALPWEESDDEIDVRLNKMMGDKMSKMLK